MKNWKQQWKQQLENTVPALDERIMDMPITAATQSEYNGGNTLARKKKATLITALTLLAVILLGTAIVCGIIFSPKPVDEAFAFTVEINPTITIITDADGNVTAIVSSNSDADVILADSAARNTIIGKPLEEAISWYADRAFMLGYLNGENNAVRISACEKGNELLAAAESALERYFIEKGNFSIVICESVGIDEFNNRSGLNIGELSKSALDSYVSEVQTLFNDRKSQSATVDELIDLYKDIVLTADLTAEIKDFISDNLSLIEQYSQELADKIVGIIDNFSTDILLRYSSLLDSVFKLIGVDDNEIIKLISLPDSLQEFTDKLATALRLEFDRRKADFEDIYANAVAITEQQYADFIDGIIAEYGSLENYWQQMK